MNCLITGATGNIGGRVMRRVHGAHVDICI
jgi:uncharacterized protein YbjT (DUF2867 family)